MKKKLQIARLYAGITDDAMLTAAETMRDMFENDQPEFQNLDSQLNNAFKTNWDAKINAARKVPANKNVTYGIEELKNALTATWENCKKHYTDAVYYIQKAYQSKELRNVFGSAKEYKHMSHNQYKVIPFMDTFFDQAQAHNIALINAGYTQAQIDQTPVLTELFKTAQGKHYAAKKERPVITKDRVEKMNAVWQMLKQVSKASKRIYLNNPAKRKMYLLPQKKK